MRKSTKARIGEIDSGNAGQAAAAVSVPVEPDEVLVARARADGAAFGALYERYLGNVYNYVYYRVNNVSDAEDLTARVFYQALTHLPGYASRDTPFVAWLYRIAHNLVFNWHRERRRRPTFALDDAILNQAGVDDDLLDGAAAHQEAGALRIALKRLPEDRQQLLVLKYAAGLTNAQIGAAMGKSERAVKALLHRTLVTLRTDLERRGGLDHDVS